MTIDFWGLGLQAINVLILVWLLSRVFWRPVAAAIVARRDAAQAILTDAQATRAKADAALAELTAARDGIAGEREDLLAKAAKEASAARAATLAEARAKAESLLTRAAETRDREAAAARAKAEKEATELAVDIARKLLTRVTTADIQETFLTLLLAEIDKLSTQDKATLAATPGGITLVSPTALDGAAQATVTKALRQKLATLPKLHFVTDPALIAGFEIRTPHFVLHNSWQADLDGILKALNHAA